MLYLVRAILSWQTPLWADKTTLFELSNSSTVQPGGGEEVARLKSSPARDAELQSISSLLGEALLCRFVTARSTEDVRGGLLMMRRLSPFKV